MDANFTFILFFVFGGVMMLALVRSGKKAPAPAVSAFAAEPAQGNGNIVILFFVMLAMMFVVATAA